MLALETIRVTGAVPALVMMPDGVDALSVGLETTDNLSADGRVLLDLLTLLDAQLPWLFQGSVPGANLTQIVDMSRGDDCFGSQARNLWHRTKDRADMLRNPDRVSVGVRVTPFQSVSQSLHGDPGLVVRLLDALESRCGPSNSGTMSKMMDNGFSLTSTGIRLPRVTSVRSSTWRPAVVHTPHLQRTDAHHRGHDNRQ